MSSQLLALRLDARDPARLAGFWAVALGREVTDSPRGVLLPGSETQVGLRFVPERVARVGPDRTHLHLTSASTVDQERVVATAIEHGATHLDVGQLPEEGHVVLADPEGNAFCVIEPGNSFLAGCGLLGEIACDGTRQVGLFWAEALGWPLVWDRDQQTAVQSPHGGTKVAWGGEAVPTQRRRRRQRLDLTLLDGGLGSEVDRLVALGAARLGAVEDGALELTDPDGNQFHLSDG